MPNTGFTNNLEPHALSFPLKRILLKLSGEVLMGQQSHGYDTKVLERLAKEVKAVHNKGIQVAVVIGGGNIYRGIQGSNHGIDRTTSDYMGMLGTIMNGLALQSAFEKEGLEARLQSALPLETICETYIKRRAISHLEKGRVVIFAAGTGNPYFTTDTAAVLRASEMHCDALFKGTKVDGIYSADPTKHKDAEHYQTLTYEKVLRDRLAVMDMAGIALARDNHLPIVIFSIEEHNNLLKVVQGEGKFTLVNTHEHHP